MSPPQETDLAVIQEFCRQAAVAAVADLVRAQNGTVASPEQAYPAIPGPPVPVAPRQRQPEYQTVTVHPVRDPYYQDLTWWQRHWHRVAISCGASVVVGLIVWGGYELVSSLSHPTADPESTVSSLLVIAVIVGLRWLFRGGGGSGGGRTFSGTFHGRMH
ncbi:MAG: hypothetical protein ACRDUW_15785 [Pseudonocardiaceae bacterium]